MRFQIVAGLLLATALTTPGLAALPAPAPVAELVKSVDIPYESFTLPNGLRVIVHTDRKAPIVAVSVWYHIGSKDEPAGKTGFAHLFEHLMFGGSENNKGSYIKTLEGVGATQLNGTTWFDRTNYFQNVPTPALPLALYYESDRMGHLLGAVTQQQLDVQRGVVQNEKRQGDNDPLGLTEYAKLKAMFPEGHPYRHSTIGSMADLDAASMADVRSWFKANYGPGNAVLVLAGDIDVATARPLVEKFFGDIPAGPTIKRYDAPVPVWTTTRTETMYDQIPTPQLDRNWVIPGRLDGDTALVDVALTILAGGGSSRLYNELVRDKKLAVAVSGGAQPFEKISMANIAVTLAKGADPKAVDAIIDRAIADFVNNGPTADEVSRVATRNVTGTIRGLEAVGGFGGKAVTLAEGAVYAGDPDFYKKELAAYAAATPASVKAAAAKWLGRGDYRLTVLPGTRPKAEDSTPATTPPVPAPAIAIAPRAAPPAIGGTPSLTVPAVERATLANGMQVELVQRQSVPLVRMALSFDAGYAADDRAKLGVQGLGLGLLDEGAAGMTGPQIAEARERLGAAIGASAGPDRTRIVLDAVKPNLAASLALFADIVQRPDFKPAEIERVRGQVLTGIALEEADPNSITRRILPVELYGAAHPYGVPSSGSGTAAGVKAVTRDDIVRWHKAWIRPDNARLFVVGDITMAELKPLLEESFGTWQPDAKVAKGDKQFPPVTVPRGGRIILVDRPGSPQSFIRGGVVLPTKGMDDPIALRAANDILGGLFSSRLNMDIRENKSWAYGVSSGVGDAQDRVTAQIVAPVQADRTGDSIAAMIADVKALAGAQPITAAERDATIDNTVRSLPGDFESGAALLGAIEKNAIYARGDDYYGKLVPRLQALTPAQLNEAAKLLSTDNFTWVVVGDRKVVEPQLQKLGLPIVVR
ncbi:M16 family metallopeptidase [Polymorphobacter fuscus]|uniref:Insulinase family protein n=1 Tax=Sandarakinorhabdus fusca TaxID=1439888 RepID=A0A7C9KXA8_9SPHN|nr:pitrilysin family protein [Polymorphobacter fuscus]KAB7646144.1 insulinase family protein [Polymorphobacter fuscus]MQT17342.1 insulinase family protein [Polymorphobacter fuscus]NJC10124.1 putative Zn-dependent peptidase [Polymorphobacter fuscus]